MSKLNTNHQKRFPKRVLEMTWEQRSSYLWRHLTVKGRDIVLINSDKDMIDTRKTWTQLNKESKYEWMNWIFRA